VTILALSTSTERGSVALLRGDDTVAATSYVDLQGHAERLFAAIDEVLTTVGARRADLSGLACDVGPGSFTGIRVGVASLKGIALGLALPLVGVVSLEAMAAAAFAHGAAGPDDTVLAAIDAKKAELFVAAYGARGEVILAPHTRASGDGALQLPLGGARRLVVVGSIAEALRLPEGATLARGDELDLPHAAWIGRCAALRASRGRPSEGTADADAARVEPLYVRAPDAKPSLSGYTARR
jgi:tRNA threonylcarbamoyladenosine biosynthesis protein TsaB